MASRSTLSRGLDTLDTEKEWVPESKVAGLVCTPKNLVQLTGQGVVTQMTTNRSDIRLIVGSHEGCSVTDYKSWHKQRLREITIVC